MKGVLEELRGFRQEMREEIRSLHGKADGIAAQVSKGRVACEARHGRLNVDIDRLKVSEAKRQKTIWLVLAAAVGALVKAFWETFSGFFGK